MANTLTNLIPVIYEALDVVSRENIGFIPNVQRDAKAETAALNQTITAHVVPAITAEDITPGSIPADSGDQSFGTVSLSITKERAAPIRWTGNEQMSVADKLGTIQRDQFAQAFRTLANEVEVDLAALMINASRATGTAGQAPFGTAADLSDLANLNQILDDNGAPPTGRICLLNSAARAKLEGKHSELFKVNESGDAGALLRNRQMRMLMGFTMGYSAGFASHTAGTGTSYQVNHAAYAAGATSVVVDTGSGTVLAGDVVTWAGDSNKYVVGTGIASAGTLVLNKPGLRATLADDVAMTIGATYSPNLAFTPNALVLATRLPAMPEGGDDADDIINVTDPISGLVFQVAMYRQYRRVKIEVGLAWGVKAIKSEHMAILLG